MPLRGGLVEKLGIDSACLVDGKYLCFRSRRGFRVMSAVRLVGEPRLPQAEFGFGPERADQLATYLATLLRLRNFFSGLQKRGIPCTYMATLNPISADSGEIVVERKQLRLAGRSGDYELRRLESGIRTGFFQTEVVLLVWADRRNEPDVEQLERNLDSPLASLLAVFPEMEAVELRGGDLVEVIGTLFCPFREPRSNILIAPEVASLTSFVLPTPSSASDAVEPEFPLPNPESVVGDGPLLGWVRKYGRNLYPVSLRLRDLEAHCAIFGVTGSGKSTSFAMSLS